MSGALEIPANRSRIPLFAEQIVRAILRKLAISGKVSYATNLRLGRNAEINSLHGLSIGAHVSVGRGSTIEVDGEIGDFCLIGRGVQIVGRADHDIGQIGVPMAFSTWVGDRASVANDSVSIGRDVWIGGGALILGGVAIGDGAVIGGGAVVSRDIEPFGIAVGNPARVVKLRFGSDQERVEHLSRLARLSASIRGQL
jgi:acetyltransferase-like isoleucine patch superfamily enzyme